MSLQSTLDKGSLLREELAACGPVALLLDMMKKELLNVLNQWF